MSLTTDDRAESPHGRGVTDIMHVLGPFACAALDPSWLSVWVAVFLALQVAQVADAKRRGVWGGLALGDLALDVALTAAGAAAWFAVPVHGSLTVGLALTAVCGGLYVWRHRKAWGLA